MESMVSLGSMRNIGPKGLRNLDTYTHKDSHIHTTLTHNNTCILTHIIMKYTVTRRVTQYIH